MGTNERGEDSTIDDAAIAAALSIDERDVASIDAQIERDAALARSLSDAHELVLDVDGELDRAIARAVAEAETGLVDVVGERSALKNAFVPKLNDFVVDASTTGPPAASGWSMLTTRGLLLRLDFYGVRGKRSSLAMGTVSFERSAISYFAMGGKITTPSARRFAIDWCETRTTTRRTPRLSISTNTSRKCQTRASGAITLRCKPRQMRTGSI